MKQLFDADQSADQARLDEFEQAVKDIFPFLFSEFGFEVFIRSASSRSVALVLQSNDCLIQFYSIPERADHNILFGPRSAADPHRETWPCTDSEKQWFYVASVVSFFDRQPVAMEVQANLEASGSFQSREQQFRRWAARLEPVCIQAVAFFRQDGFAHRRAELIQFKTEYTRAYGEAYRAARACAKTEEPDSGNEP